MGSIGYRHNHRTKNYIETGTRTVRLHALLARHKLMKHARPAPRISEAVKIEPSRATPIEKQSRPQTAPVKVGSPTKSTQQKPGYEYPEVHTSNIDFDADPTYKPAGKTITEVDFDAGSRSRLT